MSAPMWGVANPSPPLMTEFIRPLRWATPQHQGVEAGVGAGWSVMPVRGDRAFQEVCMHGIIYLVGLVVVIMAILTLFGLR
jgi:hypothetical protein